MVVKSKPAPRPKGSESGPELFFGLIGAVGSDLKTTSNQLQEELRAVGYIPVEVRLSHLMSELKGYGHLKRHNDRPEDERIDAHMEAGNSIRKKVDHGDGVIRLGISQVQQYRFENCGLVNQSLPRRAYIFNSLKHPGEVDTLKRIYGDAAFIISTYEPRDVRFKHLVKKISKSRKKEISRKLTKEEKTDYEMKANYLMEKDEKEIGIIFGQNVRDTFPLADLFIADSRHSQVDMSLEEQIRRFVRLVFGARFLTPMVDEYGIFHATAAALRSADLSRQVGAVIATDEGGFIAAGCNEVPKAGGGSVWAGSKHPEKDYRDYKLGEDAAAQLKHEIILEIFEALRIAGWIANSDMLKNKSPEELTSIALYGDDNVEPPVAAFLKDKRVANILEFGRIVHAEMSAISDAARRGQSVLDATLYCTTFPCHMCARHILASGIKRVVYIEPYPKSLAKDLYEKSIRVDGDQKADGDALVLQPFVGVAPRRYLSLFEMLKRKDEKGFVLTEDHIDRVPRSKSGFSVYADVENVYTESLKKHGLVASDAIPAD